MGTFTNSHIHIFTSDYAPEYYLEVSIPSSLHFISPFIKRNLENRAGRLLTGNLLRLTNIFTPKRRILFERYLEFVRIGTSSSQKEIFEKVRKVYQGFPAKQFIVLSVNLDYMDIEKRSYHAGIDAQLNDLIKLKAIYPNELFPFVSVDPRYPTNDLLKWLQGYLKPDGAFYGIKIYPSKGFFPFDPRLDSVYKWAEENEIPIMTHCTRAGSFYVGKRDVLISANPASLNPTSQYMPEIYEMIDKTLADASIKNKNDQWTNIFTHPRSYLPVLEKYPKLKICFAHLGGENEVLQKSNPKEYLGPNWYIMLKDLLNNGQFPNVYGDISYTLNNIEALRTIKKDLGVHPRLLYGTDYYMTEQEENNEPKLLKNFIDVYGDEGIKMMAVQQPANYLWSKIKAVRNV